MKENAMITQYDFGKIMVNGTWYHHDLRIKDETVLPDWWRRSGHICDIEDVADILADGPEILILGQGKPGMMRAANTLKHYLQQQGIILIQQPTMDAVQTFNDLHERKKVAAGFHLTC